MSPARLVAIVGPTASGKSTLADLVAQRLGGAVVSMDAMQVYRGMDIGTAKTPPAERLSPLLMVDVASPAEDYSVRRFQRDARACIEALSAEDRWAVLCGGTGLYLDSVIDEMTFPPGKGTDVRRRQLEDLLRERGPHGLHALLAEQDPASAALIHPNNARRTVRALELLAEGTSYARQHAGLHQRRAHYSCPIFALRRSREQLYERIDQRVDEMMDEGLVDEVRALVDAGALRSRTARQAIGYKEIIAYLEGSCSLAEAVMRIKQGSRRYAKRQMSWIRRDGRAREVDIEALGMYGACDLIVRSLVSHG